MEKAVDAITQVTAFAGFDYSVAALSRGAEAGSTRAAVPWLDQAGRGTSITGIGITVIAGLYVRKYQVVATKRGAALSRRATAKARLDGRAVGSTPVTAHFIAVIAGFRGRQKVIAANGSVGTGLPPNRTLVVGGNLAQPIAAIRVIIIVVIALLVAVLLAVAAIAEVSGNTQADHAGTSIDFASLTVAARIAVRVAATRATEQEEQIRECDEMKP